MYLWGSNIWLDIFMHIAVTSNISLWNSLKEFEIQVTTHFSKMLALSFWSTSAETVFPWFAWKYTIFSVISDILVLSIHYWILLNITIENIEYFEYPFILYYQFVLQF